MLGNGLTRAEKGKLHAAAGRETEGQGRDGD